MRNRRIYFILGFTGFIFINICTKMFIFDLFLIKGNSMYPTIKDNTYVCIMKSAYGIRLPKNVYEIPWLGTLLYYILPTSFIEESFKKEKRKRNALIIFAKP